MRTSLQCATAHALTSLPGPPLPSSAGTAHALTTRAMCSAVSSVGALVPTNKPYTQPAGAMLKLVLARQFKLFKRNPTLIRARIVQNIVIGLIIGGLWYNEPVTAANSRYAPAPMCARQGARSMGAVPAPLCWRAPDS